MRRARRDPASALLVMALLALAGPSLLTQPQQAFAQAAFVSTTALPVDDSASVVMDANFSMRWRAQTMRQFHSQLADGVLPVRVVLDVHAWKGRRARIYMRMPPVDIRSLSVRWSTRGELLPGSLLPGQRALVYEGALDSASLQDLMLLTFTADGRELSSAQRVSFTYEIELEPA